MLKSDYIATNDERFAYQLLHFKTTIPAYAASLNVSPEQVASQAADTAYFSYVLASQVTFQAAAQQWTSWKNLARAGGTSLPAAVPSAPTLPATAPAVASGIATRFRALVKQLKSSPNYNSATGEALGIEGPEHTSPNLTNLQPDISARLNGSHIEVTWGWQGNRSYLDMIEIQVDRADGNGSILLAYDTTPGYTDTAPLPATPAMWTYRAIYCLADNRVGQWSNPTTLTVG